MDIIKGIITRKIVPVTKSSPPIIDYRLGIRRTYKAMKSAANIIDMISPR